MHHHSEPHPPIDVREDDGGYLIEVPLAGIDEPSLCVEIHGGSLEIGGRFHEEDGIAAFRRILLLPADADARAKRVQRDGATLRVFLPKHEGARLAS